MRARVPIGTTSSTPVKAVPPGLTVVGSTSSVVVADDVLWTVVGATVGIVVVVVVVPPPPPPPGVVVVVVGVVVVVVGVVVVVVLVVVVGVVVVVVGVVVVVVLVVVVGVVVVVVGVVVVVVLVVVVGVVVVVVLVVVVGVVVVVVGVVVVVVGVVVVVVPGVQCEMVRTTFVGTGRESSQVHVTTAFVFRAFVAGPGTSALKLLPCGGIGMLGPPFTLIETLLTWVASLPSPVKIQSVVPEQGTKPAPLIWFQVVCCVLANAAVGRMTHVIISSVPAVTAMRPAAVRRLLWSVLRCAGIFPTSIGVDRISNGGHLCPPPGIVGPRIGLLHPPKVPDCR
jgi:hypothetical protein